ncbi:serine hydrolase [Flavobacterium foetidum]|uniref:serine hydrolase n=1 Tax=Flavobacterium foetidum TaxID=2026681 RepID=UPI0010751E34|nr:serine hydrolase [Flavobacterium foetidum]KAF2508310.1 serine hydrolase [Flavobacterium foetidum]
MVKLSLVQIIEKTFFTTALTVFYCLSIHSQTTENQVDVVVNREMKERKIPGLQVAIVQNGKIIVNKSYGIAYVQDNIPVQTNSVFAINSITKVFTGTAIIQLAEAGKIDIAAPVSNYLDILPESWSKVTIKQLLTHTSGLPDVLQLMDPETGGFGTYKNEKAVWEKLITLPMNFTPGERFSYNQTNGDLLGKIIEIYSGKKFVEKFEEQFDTADMKHTVFGDSRDVIPHMAPTYFWRTALDGNSLSEPKLINNYFEFPYFRRTSSGLNSTSEDLAKWVIALTSGKLLSKASLEMMWQPSKFNNGKQTPWALGWGMNKFRPKHRAVGMSGGGRSAFLIYPDDDLSVIVLTNLGGSYPEDFLEELAGIYNSDIIKSDPVTLLRTTLREIGFDKAISFTEKEKKSNPYFVSDEFELNEWAYRLAAKEQNQEALEIFKLNVHLFPHSWNAYDSYGEILLKTGDEKKAVEMYQKSVELNPKNEHGIRVLQSIQKK